MILYGRNLSPFARRVAIWCALQGREVERRELTVMGADFERLREVNPVGRVPVLELDDGTTLIETWAICDWLEETAPEGRRLVPERGVARRDCLQRLGLANSVAEKAVALVYERNRRPEALHWAEWQERIAGQVRGGLAELDARVPGEGWSGGNGPDDVPDGGDVAAIIAHQFIEAMNPWLLEPGYPRLAALAGRGMEIEAIAATKPVV
ncbi:MAG TPA: glutathione S-transferase family protein [Thermohalobaculum sp.]|nr:glutathione S-transferase family protein [Thermohalobaculum sp.]